MAQWPISENIPFVEELYEKFVQDEHSVDEEWRNYFKNLQNGYPIASALGPSFKPRSIFAAKNGHAISVSGGAVTSAKAVKQDKVAQLVTIYRMRGHLFARLDPLGLNVPPKPDIELKDFGLEDSDLDEVFTAGGLRGTLREIIQHLQETYCRTIGVELAHIQNTEIRSWLRDRMESTRNHIQLTRDEQLKLLEKLTDAEIFEQFLQTNFLGAKRFSLEGGESLVPLMERIVEHSALSGAVEMVIGMAHRGRLNILANVLNKPAHEIFSDFKDVDEKLYMFKGDVKYHLGHSEDRVFGDKKIHLSLSFNPSHLEFVDAVVAGRVRAKQTRRTDPERKRVIPLIVHGDAAFAGQGIVAEMFNMSQLDGYTVGGTIHVIVNNQVGFTTDPQDARSSHYATDVAKMLDIPIFHVNGEDPEAVAQVVKLAADFRHIFNRDVVIDLLCYRKYGHNEGDEPRYTQPLMYQRIDHHASVREHYVKKLIELGQITQEKADEVLTARKARLEQELKHAESQGFKRRPPSAMAGIWSRYKGGADKEVPDVDTGVPAERLVALAEAMRRMPDDFHLHKKVAGALDERLLMQTGKKPMNWGAAETLAYATLVTEGAPVRISGQDVERGTFTHRHAVLRDIQSGARHAPISHLAKDQAWFECRNSPLSEVSVLGFEYGFSLDIPEGLTIWEAQFGDFANAAQVIIDQFITAGEEKWNRLSGVTLFLPHGYEGQGPEHSSARLERFLNLASEDNVQVCYPTTPAQVFHLLRRQVLRPWRKPLVVMTPKSLLRLDIAVSELHELTTGRFQRVIDDPAFGGKDAKDPAKVARVILCTGKVYFDLEKERIARKRDDVAIVRVEQLHPMPFEQLEATLKRYKNHKEVVWVQEEPLNQGAWGYIIGQLDRSGLLRAPLLEVTRPRRASPATGSHKSHGAEQRQVIAGAFEPIVTYNFYDSRRV